MKKNLMSKAHKMTKEIVKKYGDVDYKTQLALCLSYLAEEEEKSMEVNSEKLEYTFRFEKVGHQIALTLKDTEYTPEVRKFEVDGKEYKVARKLEDPFVKEEQRRAYAIALTKELKSVFNTKATMLRLNEESEDFVRNYKFFRNDFILKIDEEKFNRDEKIEATITSYDGRSFNIKSNNLYAKKLVENINKVLGSMIKHLESFKSYEVNDAHHYTTGYELTGKDLEDLSKKALAIANKIEEEKEAELVALKEKAAKEGKQLIEQWTENKRCEVIICKRYMMPDGTIKVEKERTW